MESNFQNAQDRAGLPSTLHMSHGDNREVLALREVPGHEDYTVHLWPALVLGPIALCVPSDVRMPIHGSRMHTKQASR